MDKQTARQLVEHTFQNAFNKERFVHFIKEFLNHFDEDSFVYRGNYIRDSYKPYIQSLERIGKYEDSEGNKLDILIVQLKKGSSLDRARTMQRNFIAWYLNGSRGGELKDAALVAFVSPDSTDWRFSLVTMEYKLTETPNGTVKAQAEYTPARRFSFLVGEHETSHTAQSRLVPIIEDDEHNPTLKRIEEAFNIEKATKEFFEKYRNLYFDVVESLDELLKKDSAIKEDFEAKGIIVADFAKKLLGQIVFLYFLQKKGWFGVKRHQKWGSGSKGFLRELFAKKHGDYQNFFNDILEPLFYEALRLERPEDYYSRFDCRIPFLNGGLFDPLNEYDWIKTDILLPNKLFANSSKTKEGDLGTGILDIFDRYNFTVNEDEPLEKEVAVDPEMLGKVFENLLEVKDRKSKGTYYTPREIVHYMCQESLINYLATGLDGKASKEELESLVRFGETVVEHESRIIQKGHETDTYSFKLPESIRDNAKLIDEKLGTIRICDPAVGSGAFPVGMMSEIIRARGALTPHIGESKERTPYNFKRHAIQESLYGVDIDPGAIEIAKLRLWLSLVVDEENRETVQPLPNLDFKIMQGNSLVELISYVSTGDQRRDAMVSHLKKLKDELFNITSPSAKKSKRQEIEDLIKQFSEYDRSRKIEFLEQKIKVIRSQGKLFEDRQSQKEDEKKVTELKSKVVEIKHIKIPGPENHFEWHINFSEVFQEKGGFDVVIANPPYIKEYVYKKAFDGLKKSPYYQGKMDIWTMFACVSIDLLKNEGILSFIAPNNWISNAGASILRDKILKDGELKSFIDFGNYKIFEHAGIQTMIFVFKKVKPRKEYLVKYLKVEDENLLSALSGEKQDICIKPDKLIGDNITFASEKYNFILEKIASKKNFELTKKEVAQGIVAAPDKYFIVKDLSKFTDKECKFIKPFYTSTTKYHFVKPSSFIFYFCDKNFKDKKISDYPNIQDHFEPFKQILSEAKIKYGSPDKPYFYLHREREERFFQKGPKIVSQSRTFLPRFLYTDEEYYGSRAMNYIKTDRINLKYLSGLLNSNLSYFWLKNRGKQLGDLLQIDTQPLLNIPLIKPNKIIQERIAELVTIAIKLYGNYYQIPMNSNESNNIKKEINKTEEKIDQEIYKLYDLDSKEIEIINHSINKK